MGEPGRRAVIEQVPILRRERAIDFVIVNGENAAGGRGITPKIAIDLLRAGVAVITTGDHVWDQFDLASYLETEPRVLRPLNYPSGTPGAGSVILETDQGRVAVLNAQGRTFMNPPLENPLQALEQEIRRIREEEGVRILFVDFHAEATSEKIAMGYALDGSVSAVVGTHTHVQTADEQILPGGTAFLCDAGMCGPMPSVLGREVEPVLHRFRTSLPARFPVAKGPVLLCGVLVEVEEETGQARHIERLRQPVEPPNDGA